MWIRPQALIPAFFVNEVGSWVDEATKLLFCVVFIEHIEGVVKADLNDVFWFHLANNVIEIFHALDTASMAHLLDDER